MPSRNMNRYNASTAGSSNNNNMAISARTSQGSVAYTEKTIEANCAVTLLLDVSGSMSGAPIRALVAEVRRLVPLLPEHTPLTIWTFNDYVKKLTHTKVGDLDLDWLEGRLLNAVSSAHAGGTHLYPAIEYAARDMAYHAKSTKTVRFFIVLSDGGDTTRQDPASAKTALEQCTASHIHPIFIAAGAPATTFAAVAPPGSLLIRVGSNSAADMANAFQQATQFILAQLVVKVNVDQGQVVTKVTGTGATAEQARNQVSQQLRGAANINGMGALLLAGAMEQLTLTGPEAAGRSGGNNNHRAGSSSSNHHAGSSTNHRAGSSSSQRAGSTTTSNRRAGSNSSQRAGSTTSNRRAGSTTSSTCAGSCFSRRTGASSSQGVRICQFYQQGSCIFGSSCKNLHI